MNQWLLAFLVFWLGTGTLFVFNAAIDAYERTHKR